MKGFLVGVLFTVSFASFVYLCVELHGWQYVAFLVFANCFVWLLTLVMPNQNRKVA